MHILPKYLHEYSGTRSLKHPQFCCLGRQCFGKYPQWSPYLQQVLNNKSFLLPLLGWVVSFGWMSTKRQTQLSDNNMVETKIIIHPQVNCPPVITQVSVQFSSVQLLSRVRLFATPWIAAARPPCPSPTPGVHSDSCPSSPWCHPAISSSVVPFSSCPQSLPASESFPMSQPLSALASFLPKKSQGWSPSEWTGWISLQSKGLSRVFSGQVPSKSKMQQGKSY